MQNDEINKILEKIKNLTAGYTGEDKPLNRLDWLKSLISAYQKYFPARVIEKIKIDPTAKNIEGERRIITVLFADLSGFTALSETMDAEDIAKIINEFFTRMVKIVHKYGGSVDKFLGDALMVLFGAPVAHYDDPERAVRAALEMQQEMVNFNTEKKFASPLSMSIGINSGPAVALNVGSEQRMEYTVIGDTVNLAARLESISGPGEIIISQFTYEKIADIVDAEKRPSVKVKGKKKPVVNYLVKGINKQYRLPKITRIKFIGRNTELEIIKDSLAQMKNNRLMILGLTGEPGSGKTRLGIEAELTAQQNNFKTIAVRCMPYEINNPYITIIALLNNYFQLKKDSNEEEKKLLISLKLKNLGISLDDTLPYIGVLFGMNFLETQDIPPEQLKKRIFESIKRILQSEAKKSALFIRIEDLQWSDPTSIELFDYLLKNSTDIPVQFFFEYRPDYTFSWAGMHNCKNIVLKNFTKNETTEYIRLTLAEDNIAQEIVDYIYEKSQGNPLYITEIIKLLIKKNGIKRTKQGVITTGRLKDLAIAESISNVILDQIDRMSEFDKRILQYASVVGRVFELDLLGTILKIPQQNLSSDLERLEHFEGVLLSNIATNTYEFISPTTYEVVYSSLLKTKRKELHTLIGNTLEKMPEDKIYSNIETLAYHFANSNDIKKGIYYLKSAADKSYRYYALKETLNFFEQALTLLGKKELSHEELQDKLEILRRMGWVLRLVGRLEEAIRNQKRSLKLARKVASLKDEAGANLNIGIIYQEMGVPKKGLNYWTRAKRIAKKIGDRNIQVLAENNLGNYYLHSGNLLKASEYFNEVVSLSEEIGDKRGMAFANLNLGAVMERKGDFAKALEYYKSGYSKFEEIGDKQNILRSLHQIGIAQMWLGNFDECLRSFNTVIELSIKFGDRMMESLALGSIGETYGRIWQLDKAYKKFSQSLAIAQILGEPQQITVSNINIGDVHLYQGRLSQAIEHHKKSIEIAKQTQDHFNEALAQRSLGWDYYYSAAYKQAIEKFQRSESIFQKIGDRRNGVVSNLARTAALLKFGDIEEIEPMIKGIGAKAREINDLEILALALDIEADCLIFKKNNEGALEILSQLQDLSTKIGNKRLYAWTIVKSGNIQRGIDLTKEIGDKILEIKILIFQAKKFEKNSDYKNALITLNKANEQAEQCGAKELNAEALFLIGEIFTKIGKENEGKTYKNKYNKIIKEITKNFSRKEKDRYTERFSQYTLDLF